MNTAAKIILILLAATAACSRNDDSAVPRRTAYPRLELYADSTVTAGIGGVSFDINAGADTATPRDGWLDIAYPRYNAVIHVTVRRLASAEELEEAIANRAQRMSLNLGERTAMASDFENEAGFTCSTLTSLDGGPTPMQFMAYRVDGSFISGVADITGPSEPADSIGPTVRALAADAEILLKSLR